jgi:opacity protein-like surface antigen
MKRTLAVLAAALLTTAAASAQSYPDDSGAGTKLGIEQLNTSGQVGTVTLFQANADSRVAVSIDGANGRAEAVRVYRGRSCDQIANQPAYLLSNLGPRGFSRTVVHASNDKLLSGNYNVVVFSSTQAGGRAVACGHLFR